MAAAVTNSYTLTPPALPPPTVVKKAAPRSLGDSLSTFVDRVEMRRAKAIESDADRIEMTASEMMTYQREMVRKMFERIDAAQREETWGALKNVAYAIGASISIILGGTLLSSGNPMGGFLIGAGAATLGARGLEMCGVSREVSGTLALVASGLALAGSYGTYGAIAADPQASIRLITSMAQAAVTIAGAGANFGEGWEKAKNEWLQAESTRLQVELDRGSLAIDEINEETKIAFNKLEANKMVAEASRAHLRAIGQILTAPAA